MSLTEEEKLEVQNIVKMTIFNAFNINLNTEIEYLSIQEAAKFFGYDSPRPLYHLINNGVLRVGDEVEDRRSSGSLKANYYFNKKACVKRLKEKPEKRAN